MRFLVAALLVAVVNSQSPVSLGNGDWYLVGVPQCIRPGITSDIYVDVIKRVSVDVLVELYNKTNQMIYASNSSTVHAGVPQAISLDIPDDLPFSWRYNHRYYIRVTGFIGNARVFQNETVVQFNSRNVTGYVQTDKPIYKPGQTVHYRIFSLKPNLQVNKDSYTIEIRDPKRNRIVELKGLSDPTGLVKGSLELSAEPLFGIWSMSVYVNGNNFYKSFEVREYVLPRVEVTVTPPPFIVKNQTTIDFNVDAKYTFGEDVRGTLLVTFKSSYWWHRDKVQPLIQRTIPNFIGSTKLTLTNLEIMSLQPDYVYGVRIEANLTEFLTGSVATGNAYSRIYNTAEKLTYESSSARTFKPGMDFTVFAKLSQQDGTPIVGTPDKLQVQLNYTYQLTKDEISTTTTTTSKPKPKPTVGSGNGTFGIDEGDVVLRPVEKIPQPGGWSWWRQYVTKSLPLQDYSVPPDGIVEIIAQKIPARAENIKLIATYKGEQYSWYAQRAYSPSNTFIQVIVVKQLRRPGQKQKLRIKSNEPITSYSLLVTSRGRVVMTREETKQTPTKLIGIAFTITRDMAPRARVVVYLRTQRGEIVPDVVTFNVLDPFNNQVSIGFSEEEVQPGDNVTMTVRTAPNSLVATRVIDKKVLLLKSENDITEEQVINSLWGFDQCGFYGWWGWGRGMIVDRRRRKRSFIPWRYPYYGSGTDAFSVFSEAGLIVLTDSLVYRHNYFDNRFDLAAEKAPSSGTGSPDGRSPGDGELKEVGTLRTKFPETWLFMVEAANANGILNVSTTAPDSITSWQASAYAFNDQFGFGISSEPAKLTVVKPFFASLYMPYSIIRGEELFLQVNVFNYMEANQTVVVELRGSDGYENLDIDENGVVIGEIGDKTQTILVPSGFPKSVVFPIRLLQLGNVPITVTARSTAAADGLTKTIKVEAEGVPSEYNFVELVNLTSSGQYQRTRSISYPPGLVDGSQKLGVKLVGDPLGSTVTNLARLVRMSYGCGEQNMVNFAPTVFVSQYLKAVGQLTDQRRANALNYIFKGYQRQLNYKRNDGSYSAFGERDKEGGSLWLTAFVASTFSNAGQEGFLDVDQEDLKKAYDFITSKQSKDGSFYNTGKLHNKRLQGQSGKGNGLTAYVLAALLESGMTDAYSSNISKAQAFVESYVKTSTDLYELAIGAYTLALAGSSEADSVLTTLESRTTTKGGYTYLEVEAEPIYRWEPPARQTKAASIEATSYMCMIYAMKENIPKCSECLAYLVSQQNDYGGFVSTQDTVVAVRALSAVGPFFYTPTQDGSVTVEAAGESLTFNINDDNRLKLQSGTLPVSANSVTVTGTGSGLLLVSISAKYNVMDDQVVPSFSITAKPIRDTPTSIELSVCSKYLKGESSNMANIEVGLPSGFTLTEESRQDLLTTAKRVEVLDGKVLMYFDEITNSGVCVYLSAIGNGEVNKPKRRPVRVFDYYTPQDSAITFYRIESLDRNFCDVPVCDGCTLNCAKRRRK